MFETFIITDVTNWSEINNWKYMNSEICLY